MAFKLPISHDALAVMNAMNRSQAIIEFSMDGTVLTANENFCAALGYQLAEIKGKHHRIFVDPVDAASPAYAAFWERLGSGQFERGQFRRIGKSGENIWIEASYNPVFRGKRPVKIVKFASDVTERVNKAFADAGMLEAVSRSQALIEFTPDGTILTANKNFCDTLGYELGEIVGHHHRMFCDKSYVEGAEYREFWTRLARGEFAAGEFCRFGKGGREIWIQASYNPIVNASGKVERVVKIATDVTERMSAISSLGSALGKMADGDLSHRLQSPFVPTMEGLRKDFNRTIDRLCDTMVQIGGNAQSIRERAGEMLTTASDISQRSETQAASVEETAAAVEEITTTVKDSSERATSAGQLVSNTRDSAETSRDIVSKAIEAMDRIAESSRQISSIIGVIDEIAFQTNLLALNAGVEAARAGEAGKGFAVVAQEVRDLAQRSAAAAKEIKGLIQTSGEHVDQGVVLVGETGDVLARIAGEIVEINTHVGAIVEAAREQSVGLSEINTALNSIDSGTQQFAAMSDSSAGMSKTLSSDADQLFALISAFRTGRAPVVEHPDVGAPLRRAS